MAIRKQSNGFRNQCTYSVIAILCLCSFTEALVIPKRETPWKESSFIHNTVEFTCPLPTRDYSQGPCKDKCSHDDECHGNKLCCSDGCQKACTQPLMPPPVLDWEKPPTGNRVTGNNWLVEGPEPQSQGESCSTSTPGPDIPSLNCPEGFICIIKDNGDMSRGIPNRGICVQDTKDINSIPEVILKEKDVPVKRCIQDGKELVDGEIFYRKCNMCACNKGYIICEVNECSDDHTVQDDW